jgi:hypothetical protein
MRPLLAGRTSSATSAIFAAILFSQSVFVSAVDPASSFASATQSDCLHAQNDVLAELASCGHKGSLEYCFSQLPAVPFPRAELVNCFVNAGCTEAESEIEAIWMLHRCDFAQKYTDLRKRQLGNDGSTTARTTARTTTQQQRTTVRPQTTAAPTTEKESSTDSVEVVTQTVSPSNQQTTAGPVTTPLNCLDTKTVSTTFCPIQSTGPDAGKVTLPCFPTETTFTECAAGLFCDVDKGTGNPVCMKLQTNLTTGGIVVALFFAAAIVGAIGFMTFFCCKEKSRERKLKAKAEAAAIAKAAALNSSSASTRSRNGAGMRSISGQSVPDSQPLMGPGGAPHGYGPMDDQNPFNDRHRA